VSGEPEAAEARGAGRPSAEPVGDEGREPPVVTEAPDASAEPPHGAGEPVAEAGGPEPLDAGVGADADYVEAELVDEEVVDEAELTADREDHEELAGAAAEDGGPAIDPGTVLEEDPLGAGPPEAEVPVEDSREDDAREDDTLEQDPVAVEPLEDEGFDDDPLAPMPIEHDPLEARLLDDDPLASRPLDEEPLEPVPVAGEDFDEDEELEDDLLDEDEELLYEEGEPEASAFAADEQEAELGEEEAETAGGSEPAAGDEPTPAPGSVDDEGLEDVLEDTPEFLEDPPEDERLWSEQRPPRDFDLDR
ncbi:MAG TPA: hypothetical protein VGR10_01715, partial [Thermoleophilaceae bacterium]|nr:hypothetical protein [Thermoleophilaceae bacterium]